MYREFHDRDGNFLMSVNIPEQMTSIPSNARKDADRDGYLYVYSFNGSQYVAAWDGGDPKAKSATVMCFQSLEEAQAVYDGEFYLLSNSPLDSREFKETKRFFETCKPQIMRLNVKSLWDVLKPGETEKSPHRLINLFLARRVWISKLEGDPAPYIVAGFSERLKKLLEKRGVVG